MISQLQSTCSDLEQWVQEFFQQSEGQWRSQRRYYTLSTGDVQEAISFITVQFLAQGSDELQHLAQLHQLQGNAPLVCGALTTWDSQYIGPSPRQMKGSTVFGVKGSNLYRDRGFSTHTPIIAQFSMSDPRTMVLRTEYNQSAFEEELKLIGQHYRTRQTIISRAGEEQMISQYLETRL